AAYLLPGCSGVVTDEEAVRGCADIDGIGSQRINGYKERVHVVAECLRKMVLAEYTAPSPSIVHRLVHSALRMTRSACGAKIDRPAIIRRCIHITGPAEAHRVRQLRPCFAAVSTSVEPTGNRKLQLLAATCDGAIECAITT